MNRDQKIGKLSRAIVEYRGKYTMDSKGDFVKWVEAPKPAALLRVKTWLDALHIFIPDALKKIDGFKTHVEFYNWLKTL